MKLRRVKVRPKRFALTRYRLLRARVSFLSALLLILSLSHAGCFKGQDPTTYYGNIVVPRAQEFRWSDGDCHKLSIPLLLLLLLILM